MSIEPRRTCPSCGNEFSGAMQFCPVCMLRKGLAGGVESGEASGSEHTIQLTTLEQVAPRFEHYELVAGQDGKPVELGRGAMGVTYKALDVDLHCPVTLKVISERYLGDEAAWLRFIREARAAARLRHSNVASVLYLGSLPEFTIGLFRIQKRDDHGECTSKRSTTHCWRSVPFLFCKRLVPE
jgi:hypothetical protein